MSPEQRCSQALKDFFTHEQIPAADRQAYIDQAREISATLGPEHCATWLSSWAEDARTRQAAWTRDRLAAEARINSRHKPDAESAANHHEDAQPRPDHLHEHAHLIRPVSDASRRDTVANTYAAAKQGRPRPPTGQETEQRALL